MTKKRTKTQKIKDSSSMPLKKVKKEKYNIFLFFFGLANEGILNIPGTK